MCIRDRKWNDASLFIDFTKDDSPRHFRFGVFSNIKHWNPKNTPWEKVPESDRPLVTHKKPAFDAGRWTHVALTLNNVNSGKDDGAAEMFLDGKSVGKYQQNLRLTWEPERVAIMLGIQYIGDIDDMAVFDSVLTAEQIKEISSSELPLGK